MSPDTHIDETVEVRIRYRPVGDILTVSVQTGLPAGPRFQTEPDEDTIVEWLRMPDGSRRLAALQVIGASRRLNEREGNPLAQLPEQIQHDAMDLIHPGRRHHDHPSASQPVHPTGTRKRSSRLLAG